MLAAACLHVSRETGGGRRCHTLRKLVYRVPPVMREAKEGAHDDGGGAAAGARPWSGRLALKTRLSFCLPGSDTQPSAPPPSLASLAARRRLGPHLCIPRSGQRPAITHRLIYTEQTASSPLFKEPAGPPLAAAAPPPLALLQPEARPRDTGNSTMASRPPRPPLRPPPLAPPLPVPGTRTQLLPAAGGAPATRAPAAPKAAAPSPPKPLLPLLAAGVAVEGP